MTETTQPSRWQRFVDGIAAPPTNIRPTYRKPMLVFHAALTMAVAALFAVALGLEMQQGSGVVWLLGVVLLSALSSVLGHLADQYVWRRSVTVALRVSRWAALLVELALLPYVFYLITSHSR